ncbi:MAG: bifunctional nuclease domain-containing protein, partial [Rhodothermales bacterium]
VIDELKEGTFFAKIRYIHNGEEGQLDSRPSDAVALAVRVDAPIYVAPLVLEEAGIPTDDEGVSALTSSNAPEEESSPMLSHLERMERQLAKAIEDEDYEKAARLRDEIAQMKGK